MTVVTLSFGKNGVLKKCQANGHACFSKKGEDIVCSAVTILLRTAMSVLSQMEDVCLETDISSRGKIEFCVDVKNEKPETDFRLKGISDFLRLGLKSISEEYPENVTLLEKDF